MLAFIYPISGIPSNELPGTPPGKPPTGPGKPPTGGEPPTIWPPLEPGGPGQGLRPTHPIVIMPPPTINNDLPGTGGGGGSKPPGPPNDDPGWMWLYNPVTGNGRWINVPDLVEAIRDAIGEEAQPK